MPLTLVTGGGRGIGAAISLRLASEGHDLVITYLKDRDAAESVARQAHRDGRRATALQADTADPASIDALFARIATLGPLTGLVNNAGAATAVGRLEDNGIEAIRRDLDVNLFGVIACTRRALPALRSTGGSIVNISSVAAALGGPGTYVHYAAAKAGVEAFTVGLAKEVAADGVRVNAVAPGTVWTDFHQDPERPAKAAPAIPMGRAGLPEEIAGAVAWLLSDDARYATGSVLKVAGGL
ncbi:SDR family NAD(P)-dependent oxidoreductase [Zafaria sp. J156]|uniref:SDR family NAD(P)-dependent oxidoreductase n=1 Tax=Zafaria sp. J156 TaxID=3116490 RepID=UPI002E7857DB|nr:SDR family oxidoreductase [Zafaria sp. J156]MEE1621780.1 SDR family oxidoreductase [Zafaria sp. J156]